MLAKGWQGGGGGDTAWRAPQSRVSALLFLAISASAEGPHSCMTLPANIVKTVKSCFWSTLSWFCWSTLSPGTTQSAI